MNYWIFKTEPDAFSIEDLASRKQKGEMWDGVRNYQARNMLRDLVQKGDWVIIYHSSCKVPAAAGLAVVIESGYPDPAQFNPEEKYYDPKSQPDNPRWYAVTIKHAETFASPLSLKAMKTFSELQDMKLLQKGNRLSIIPIDKKHFDAIVQQSH